MADELSENATATDLSDATAKRGAKGTSVRVVTAKGEHLPAKVTKVRNNDLLDLIFEHHGQEVIITSSPYDPEGKQPDSWH